MEINGRPPSSAPGGSDLAVQYNDDGAFNGSTLAWDDVGGVLIVGNLDANAAHQVQIYHNGVYGVVQNTNGTQGLLLKDAGVNLVSIFRGGIQTASNFQIGWVNTPNDAADGAVMDTGLTRQAAAIISATNGSTGPGVYSVPLSLAGAGNPAELRATPAFAGSGAAGGNVVLTPGAGDGAGAAGLAIVRKPGGTPGTQEVQISHDGTTGLVACPSSGGIKITGNSPVTGFLTISNAAGVILQYSSTNKIFVGNGVTVQAAGGALMQWDSSTAIVSMGAGWFQNSAGRARNTADVTNATATMANLSDLSITLIAGRKYTGRLVLIAKNSTGAEGLQFDCNGGTATMTSFGMTAEETPIGATLGVTDSTALGTALTDTVVSTGYVMYAFNLTMVCNAGGTFIPRFAEVSHTAGTATVRLGSYLWIEDMAN